MHILECQCFAERKPSIASIAWNMKDCKSWNVMHSCSRIPSHMIFGYTCLPIMKLKESQILPCSCQLMGITHRQLPTLNTVITLRVFWQNKQSPRGIKSVIVLYNVDFNIFFCTFSWLVSHGMVQSSCNIENIFKYIKINRFQHKQSPPRPQLFHYSNIDLPLTWLTFTLNILQK